VDGTRSVIQHLGSRGSATACWRADGQGPCSADSRPAVMSGVATMAASFGDVY